MENLFKDFSYILFCLIITLSCEKDFSSIQVSNIPTDVSSDVPPKIPPNISGSVSQLEPSGIFKADSCIVELYLSGSQLIENTDADGNFRFSDDKFTYEMLQDYFRIKISKPGFSKINKWFYISRVLDTVRNEIAGLEFLIQKYVNYFPIKAGNYWVYDADWGGHGGHAIGTEIWEIIEVNPDSNLFKMRSTVSATLIQYIFPHYDTSSFENLMVANIKIEDRRIMGHNISNHERERNNLIEFIRQYYYEGALDSLFVVFPFDQDSVYYYNQTQSPSSRVYRFYSELKLGVGFIELQLSGNPYYGSPADHHLKLIDYQIQP